MFLAVGYLLASVAGLLLYVGLLVQVLHERGLWRHFDPRQVILPFRAVFEFSFPLITGELALLSMKVGGVMVLALLSLRDGDRVVPRGVRGRSAEHRSHDVVRHALPADDRPAARARQHRRAARQLLAHGDVRCGDDVPDLRAHRTTGPGHHPDPLRAAVRGLGTGAVDPRGRLLPQRDVRLQRLHAAGLWPDPAPGRGEPVHGKPQHRTLLRPGRRAGSRRHRDRQLCGAHGAEPHQPVGPAPQHQHRLHPARSAGPAICRSLGGPSCCGCSQLLVSPGIVLSVLAAMAGVGG